jgi:hypothetical protein
MRGSSHYLYSGPDSVTVFSLVTIERLFTRSISETAFTRFLQQQQWLFTRYYRTAIHSFYFRTTAIHSLLLNGYSLVLFQNNGYSLVAIERLFTRSVSEQRLFTRCY